MSEITTAARLKTLEAKINKLERREHTHPIINLGTPTTLTIASGIITRARSYHLVAGQSGAADDLDTINGGVAGDLLILRASSSTVTITCKDATGNLQLAGDFALDHADDTIILLYDGANWLEMASSANST